MSEQNGTTQPMQPAKKGNTQPFQPIKKTPRWRSILTGVVGFVLLIGLGALGGYSSGIGDRQNAESSKIAKQLTEQFQFALVDMEFGRYDAARQRLEFIIAHNPSYPGAQQKLTEVLVLSVIPTAIPTATLTATPDFSGAESAFQRAQQLILAQDWPGALTALDQVRKLDPTYKTAQVDGMYYFALRNYGFDLITKQGNLEGGIYHLTLAERFGTLDNTSMGLREGARMYIIGASFWELDWGQAVQYFSQVAAGWPALWDGTMNSAERYYIALMRYGDQLFEQQQYCAAYEQYLAASAYGSLDKTAAANYNDALTGCYPPTAGITITATASTAIATTEPAATTEVPVTTEVPTETATPTP